MKKALALLVAVIMIAMSIGLTGTAFAEATSELNVAVGSQFTTLDPALNTEVVNNYVINHTYAGMFAKDDTNNAVNMLCDTYTMSDDGLEYTFNMVKDAKWSDGTAITANDFVYSYLRALSYGADNVWAINDFVTFVKGAAEYNEAALKEGATFDCTKADHSGVGIEAVDDYTLKITLKKPCAYLTKLMCSNVWLPVREDFAPQHDSQWALKAGYPASGAYTLTECNENEQCVLTKNPTFLKADTIKMDKITFKVMTDASAEALAFKTGEIDIAMSVSTDTAQSYLGTDNLWLMPGSSNYFLAINSGSTGPDWAKNVNVRRALALAIDKDTLVGVLGGTQLYPPLNGYVPTGLSGLNDDFRAEGDADGYTLKYDPEQAKKLLAEAGYNESNPLKITYKYSNNGIHGDVATMLQQMWQAVGVQATFAAVESGVFYDQLDQGDFEISRYGYSANDDPMQFLQLWTTGIQVVAAVDDPEYDKMVDEAGYIVDKKEYFTKLHEIEDYLCETNVYVIPLFNYTTPALVNNGITGYTQHGGSAYFGAVVKA